MPSSPSKEANGSKKPEISLRRGFAPTFMFAKSHITAPAGAATATALNKTNLVLSKKELFIMRKRCGLR